MNGNNTYNVTLLQRKFRQGGGIFLQINGLSRQNMRLSSIDEGMRVYLGPLAVHTFYYLN